ncbi:hypothetical protein DV515_00014035, partial [Chloebia gouldiae]
MFAWGCRSLFLPLAWDSEAGRELQAFWGLPPAFLLRQSPFGGGRTCGKGWKGVLGCCPGRLDSSRAFLGGQEKGVKTRGSDVNWGTPRSLGEGGTLRWGGSGWVANGGVLAGCRPAEGPKAAPKFTGRGQLQGLKGTERALRHLLPPFSAIPQKAFVIQPAKTKTCKILALPFVCCFGCPEEGWELVPILLFPKVSGLCAGEGETLLETVRMRRAESSPRCEPSCRAEVVVGRGFASAGFCMELLEKRSLWGAPGAVSWKDGGRLGQAPGDPLDTWSIAHRRCRGTNLCAEKQQPNSGDFSPFPFKFRLAHPSPVRGFQGRARQLRQRWKGGNGAVPLHLRALLPPLTRPGLPEEPLCCREGGFSFSRAPRSRAVVYFSVVTVLASGANDK